MKIFNIYQVNKMFKHEEVGKSIFDWAQLYFSLHDKAEAESFVINNTGDIHETCFDYVIIEERKVGSGVSKSSILTLFKFKDEKYEKVGNVEDFDLSCWPCLLGSYC